MLASSLRVLLAVLLLSSLSCNDVPVHKVVDKFSIEVSQVTEGAGPIEIDFVWVIDASTSMSEEQVALAKGFRDFVDVLNMFLGNIDMRVAVVASDNPRFNTSPATKFAKGSIEQQILPCLGNADCQKTLGPAWRCLAPDSAEDLYNVNLGVTSRCAFGCGDSGECCPTFCGPEICGDDQSCVSDTCVDIPNDLCHYECASALEGVQGCQRLPDTADCPSSLPSFLTGNTLDLFKCIATVPPALSLSGGLEQTMRMAWMALDPEGDNADQSLAFLRPNAYLVLIFVTDEDDCSIDERFAAPNKFCETDEDCTQWGRCRTDIAYSKYKGKQIKVCEGEIKADYYDRCDLLGEFKGDTHHGCAYDPGCVDCQRDEDCQAGFYCKSGKKCRPIFAKGWGGFASYQTPPGTPLFALAPVSEMYSKFRSLKTDPGKVLLAVVAGDGVVMPPDTADEEPDRPSLISKACLADERLPSCMAYAAHEGRKDCYDTPNATGCEAFAAKKLDCIRECFLASRELDKEPYVCASENGIAAYASRFGRLAAMFGPNGISANVCGDSGIGAALQEVAELVVKRVTKICLPEEPKRDESVRVTLTLVADDGSITERKLLTEGPAESGGDYLIEFPTQECCFPSDDGKCTGTLKAISFNDVLDPHAHIELRYEALVD